MTASTPLKSFLNAVAGANAFVTILEDIGLRTVGDVQELSNDAFDALVSRSQPQWLGQWLSVSVLREIQPKAMLNDVLIMFPGITTSVLLPPKLVSVRSLVDLSAREFYALDLDLKTVSACEKIRARFLPDRGYRIIDLKKEPQDSFFTHITPIILSFSSNNTHYSWRKNDPKRPVVTSLITYVNPTECSCRSREYGSCRSQLSPLRNGNWHSESTFPKHAWCTCPRMHVIAVNYELSTPSGSRCSEQNALGKLASTGLPTTVVREVFVYGDSSASKTETNPLFPCGVCENMLRKVSNDVFRQHGGDVMLYMFDSTTRPRKLIYLPIPEISFRDDRGFRKFVAELREL
ncbi:putative A distinct subfamily of CDD CDA like deaminase [Trypanosoma vivax]|nr:putative A distinct subfamily of CDD CDA like deaminase [Trypanosoma vivax]